MCPFTTSAHRTPAHLNHVVVMHRGHDPSGRRRRSHQIRGEALDRRVDRLPLRVAHRPGVVLIGDLRQPPRPPDGAHHLTSGSAARSRLDQLPGPTPIGLEELVIGVQGYVDHSHLSHSVVALAGAQIIQITAPHHPVAVAVVAVGEVRRAVEDGDPIGPGFDLGADPVGPV